MDTYFDAYTNDHTEIYTLINDHFKVYDNTLGVLGTNLLYQLEAVTNDLITMQALIFNQNDNSSTSPHLISNLINLRALSNMYWNETVKFNTTYISNSAENMFIKKTMARCNNRRESFHDYLESLLSLIMLDTYDDIFYQKVNLFIDNAEQYRDCSSEYIDMLTTLKARLDDVSPSHLRDMSTEMKNILRNLNVYEMHLPLLQVNKVN